MTAFAILAMFCFSLDQVGHHTVCPVMTKLCPGRKLSLEYEENGWEEASKAQNAKAMAKYAAAMMRSLKEMDYDKFDLRKRPDFQLR